MKLFGLPLKEFLHRMIDAVSEDGLVVSGFRFEENNGIVSICPMEDAGAFRFSEAFTVDVNEKVANSSE